MFFVVRRATSVRYLRVVGHLRMKASAACLIVAGYRTPTYESERRLSDT